MTRNLKILGVALAAAFALSAVVASAASAQIGKITSDGPVTLTGVETGGAGENSFSAFGITVECEEATYAGHKKNTSGGFIASGETEVTITPTYKKCKKASNGEAVTIDMNGCDYVFRDATTTGGVERTYGVTVDIVNCTAPIKVTTTPCNVEIPAQNGLVGFHLTHTPSPNDDIDLTGEINTIHAKTCLGLETNVAAEKNDVTITGHNELGEPTPVTITD